MKKVLYDKDGKFLSVHDGDCLTHEDGTIMIYRERKCKKDISKAFYHVYLRNNELHFLKTGMSFSYYDFNTVHNFSFSYSDDIGARLQVKGKYGGAFYFCGTELLPY